MHCGRFQPLALSRRRLLAQASAGFGSLAFTALRTAAGDMPPGAGPHAPARAKSVIFLYMDGGVSQVDSFDPKPRLAAENGRDAAQAMGQLEPTQFGNIGRVMASPWRFARHGQCGHAISELFPHIASQADQLCVIRSMTSKFPEHTGANYFLHTGSGFQGRPSMGAWVSYALGSDADDLPGYVVLNGGLTPPGGLDNFGAGFLPAAYQASVFRPGGGIANITSPDAPDRQRRKLDLLATLDRSFAAAVSSDAVEAAIQNDEIAARMQLAVPDLLDLSQESGPMQAAYGLTSPNPRTKSYGRQCLLARRLVERGVRFVELTVPQAPGNDRWDQHRNLEKGHSENAASVDQPIAALLADLRQRGLLDQTLVVWTGEFGRTPFEQGGQRGRDHNPMAFSMWIAGGGVRAGTVYGRTDEFGYRVVENRLEMHDLHATLLHLLGIDHKRATVRFSSRDMRLTDVHGHVIDDIVA